MSDSGGSVTVHTFGAYFGLLVSRILRQPHGDRWEEQQDTGPQPDALAVVGTELQFGARDGGRTIRPAWL